MLSVASGMLFIVIVYTLPSQTDQLSNSDPNLGLRKKGFVLVHYSTAKLLFASSIASTLSPYLCGCVMALWVFRVGRGFLTLSQSDERSELPTSREYSYLMELMTASLERLCAYVKYAWESKARLPRLLQKAAWVLSITFLITGTVVTCDTVLHYTTNTVPFEIINCGQGNLLMSRRLSETCLNIDRAENDGFPCSVNILENYIDPAGFIQDHNEIFELHLNASRRSTIRLFPSPESANSSAHLAILLPSQSSIPLDLDYRAGTIGASTSCRVITRDCGFRAVGADSEYSAFNCSPSFWGVVGRSSPAMLSETDPLDPDLPPLAFKPTPTLQLAFFQDDALTVPYNTLRLNASTGWPSPDLPLMPDTQLRNKVFVAIAGGLSSASQNPKLEYGEHADFYNETRGYIGFALACQYETFDVQYTWSNGTIRDIQAVRSPNGTLSELWHGFHEYHQNNFLDYVLQNAMTQAVMQPDLEAVLSTWSDLYSTQIMSVIGAFLMPHSSLVTQARHSVLASQVPIAPFAILVAFCIGYAIFGLVLGVMAWQATNCDTLEVAAKLSLEGLCKYAFDKVMTLGQPAMTDGLLEADRPKRWGIYVATEETKEEPPRRICFAKKPAKYDFMVLPNSPGSS